MIDRMSFSLMAYITLLSYTSLVIACGGGNDSDSDTTAGPTLPTRTPPVTLAASPKIQEFREVQEMLRPLNLNGGDVSRALASTGLEPIEYQSVSSGLVTLSSSSPIVQEVGSDG